MSGNSCVWDAFGDYSCKRGGGPAAGMEMFTQPQSSSPGSAIAAFVKSMKRHGGGASPAPVAEGFYSAGPTGAMPGIPGMPGGRGLPSKPTDKGPPAPPGEPAGRGNAGVENFCGCSSPQA